MGAFKIAKTVLKSVFNKPATLMYPVVEREWQERTRGSIGIEEDKCILCGICSKRCPADAINVDRKEGKWEIHRMQCIQCGECVEACPKDCLIMENKYTEPGVEKVVDVFDIKIEKPAAGNNASGDGGDLVCNRDECVYCGLCVKACPADALKVDRKEKIWEVDKEACVKCGACVDKCPKKCLSFGEESGEAAPAPSDDDKLICDLDECVYCGLCAKNCPCDALEVDRKEKLWKVDEDACVKCGACVDKCPKKCLSIGAGESAGEKKADEVKESPKPVSMPEVDADTCIYCNACANACPCEAISAEMDDWTLDSEKCIGCGECIDVCPAEALTMKEA